MLTGHGTTQSAVQGLKLGAFDYLMKPARFDELTAKHEATRQRRMNRKSGLDKPKPGFY
jgi:DNA-binding response OmpR family regulator